MSRPLDRAASRKRLALPERLARAARASAWKRAAIRGFGSCFGFCMDISRSLIELLTVLTALERACQSRLAQLLRILHCLGSLNDYPVSSLYLELVFYRAKCCRVPDANPSGACKEQGPVVLHKDGHRCQQA